jgi:ParB family chromosome partitioning protein
VTTRFEEIPVGKLDPHPKNVRKDLGDLAELALSIQAKGIEQALTVAPHPTARTKYLVLGGHRRLAAAKLAKLKIVPCMIRDDLTTEAAQTEFMLVENTHRRDLTVLEEAEAVQGLLDLGLDEKAIAANIGRSRDLVRTRAKLAKLDENVKAKLEDRTLTIEQALDLAEFEGDTYATEALLRASNDSPWLWKHSVEQLRRKRKIQEQIPKTVAALRKAGAELLEERPGHAELTEQGLTATDNFRASEHFKDWTAEQHVAAGHKAVVDERTEGKAVWIAPRPAAWDEEDSKEPEEAPEQAAQREKEASIIAGIQVAAHVRHEFLKSALLDPAFDVAQWARQKDIDELALGLQGFMAQALFDLDTEAATVKNLRAKLDTLSNDALAVLRHIVKYGTAEQGLSGAGHVYYGALAAWGPSTSYGSDYGKKWRDLLTGVFGYEFSDIEKEAMAHQAKLLEEATAAVGSDEDEDDYDDEEYDDDDED